MKLPDGYVVILDALVGKTPAGYNKREFITDFSFTGKFRIDSYGSCSFEVTHKRDVSFLVLWYKTVLVTEWVYSSKFEFVYERDCSK